MRTLPTRTRWIFLLFILLAALLLRVPGLTWGLPPIENPGAEPYHPDEFVTFEQSVRLWSNPDPIAFCWGGVLYLRTGLAARAIVSADDEDAKGGLPFRRTLLLLRSLNVLYALLTVLLVAHLGRTLFGDGAGIFAAGLFAVFPGHVLDSHFGRPDVLLCLLLTASLACSVKLAGTGKYRWTVAAALLSGLATATMLWGLSALAGLGVATLLSARGRGPEVFLRRFLVNGLIAAAGFAVGYLAGSVETLVHLQTFNYRLAQSRRVHRSPFSFPLLYVLPLSLSSLGAPGWLLALGGAVGSVFRKVGLALIPAATIVCGFGLLGSQHGNMMRYMVWLSPALALFAGYALAGLVSALADRGRGGRIVAAALTGLVLLLTAQSSVSIVAGLARERDPRILVADWIEKTAPRAEIGMTASYRGDVTYLPRFSPESRTRRFVLRVFATYDAREVLETGPEFLITTNYARQHAWGDSAKAFFRELEDGGFYEEVYRAGPPWRPLSLPAVLGFDPPDDLLYVMSTFKVYRRVSD
jgi:Dolichyl-phosphate-mannose-protein mannosyltransferase